MKDSIVFPGFESFDETTYIDNSHNVLDPEINFPKFLEEARRYAREKKQRQKEEEEEEEEEEEDAKSGTKKQLTNDEKKSRKKSWKNAFFSFWKSSSSSHNKDDNKQHSKEISRASLNPKPSGHFSGPVVGAVAGSGPRHQHRFSSSGPLAGLIRHKKLKEKKKKMKKKGGDCEIPYVSLEKLNEPLYDAKNYGPVYLVS